jgi:hypothetical protein
MHSNSKPQRKGAKAQRAAKEGKPLMPSRQPFQTTLTFSDGFLCVPLRLCAFALAWPLASSGLANLLSCANVIVRGAYRASRT